MFLAAEQTCSPNTPVHLLAESHISKSLIPETSRVNGNLWDYPVQWLNKPFFPSQQKPIVWTGELLCLNWCAGAGSLCNAGAPFPQHFCPLRSFLESLLRTTVWAPLIWSQNPSDRCISLYNILIVSWPLFECLPKRCFPCGDHSFGTSSFCYIKICSPIISTVGLGSTKGDNTE